LFDRFLGAQFIEEDNEQLRQERLSIYELARQGIGVWKSPEVFDQFLRIVNEPKEMFGEDGKLRDDLQVNVRPAKLNRQHGAIIVGTEIDQQEDLVVNIFDSENDNLQGSFIEQSGLPAILLLDGEVPNDIDEATCAYYASKGVFIIESKKLGLSRVGKNMIFSERDYFSDKVSAGDELIEKIGRIKPTNPTISDVLGTYFQRLAFVGAETWRENLPDWCKDESIVERFLHDLNKINLGVANLPPYRLAISRLIKRFIDSPTLNVIADQLVTLFENSRPATDESSIGEYYRQTELLAMVRLLGGLEPKIENFDLGRMIRYFSTETFKDKHRSVQIGLIEKPGSISLADIYCHFDEGCLATVLRNMFTDVAGNTKSEDGLIKCYYDISVDDSGNSIVFEITNKVMESETELESLLKDLGHAQYDRLENNDGMPHGLGKLLNTFNLTKRYEALGWSQTQIDGVLGVGRQWTKAEIDGERAIKWSIKIPLSARDA